MRLLRVGRPLLAAMALCAVLATALPFTTLARGTMCTLACCAGRAPHAAGSCMNGSCHASLGGHANRHSHFEAPIEPEQLCGLRRIKLYAARLPVTNTVTIDATSDLAREGHEIATDRESISTTALTKPCEAGCGSCGSSFTNSNRQRNAAAGAYADRARPSSVVKFGKPNYLSTRKLNAHLRLGAPRGPPSFS